ncbi:MAG: leucine-rich repeat domain-containing protein [Promethearchaeota archaeon]
MNEISRPNTGTRWGRFKNKMKRAGAWVYSNVLPLAISVLTGGIGMGAASAPLIKEFIQKLIGKKLQIHDDNTVSECIKGILGTGGQNAIKKLSTVLQNENPGIPVDTILARMDEVIKPVTDELEEMIAMLKEERGDMREILHGWLDEQEQRLPNESSATPAQIQAIRTGLGEKLDTIQVEAGNVFQLAKNHDQNGKMVTIVGTALFKVEADFMDDLAAKIGGYVPRVAKVEWNTFGFAAKDGHVVQLGLHRIGLTSLPDTIGNLKSLKYLDLVNNELTSLPDTIGNLTSLQTLWSAGNQLTSLPDTIGNLTSLQTLWPPGNQLTSLPDTIGNLKSLDDLDLRKNQLTSLPDTIGNLTSLQKLWLASNQLTSLPDTIGNLTSLQTLKLDHCEFTSLPDTIGYLTSVQTIELQFNRLTSLPDTIGNLKSLKHLFLGWNELTSLPDTIGNLISLNNLDLLENELTSLPDTIGNLTSLQTLDLSYNRLTSLPDTIGNLTSLQTLDLSYNRLTSLPGRVEKALKNMEKQGCSIYR